MNRCKWYGRSLPSLVLTLALSLGCAIPAAAQFERTYGQGILPPSTTVDERAYDFDNTSDGGYILVGSRSYSGITEVNAVKTDQFGQLQWRRTYHIAVAPMPYTLIGYSVDETVDVSGTLNGYIIAGYVQGLSGSVVGQDALMLKIDLSGNLIWWRAWDGGTGDADIAQSVQQTSDRGYIIAGEANYRIAPDCSTQFTHEGGDLLLVKTNANGGTLWSMVISHNPVGVPNMNDRIHRLIWAQSVQQTTPDGGYAVVGYHDDPILMRNYCLNSVTPPVNERLYFLRAMGGGGVPGIAWANTYPDPYGSVDRGYCIRQLSDGFIMVGSTQRATSDIYIVRTDNAGAVVWAKAYDGGENEIGYSIRETTSGFVVAGTSSGPSGSSGLVMEIDASGAVITTAGGSVCKLYGGAGNDEARAVRALTGNRFVAAGFSNSYGTGAGDYDMYLLNTSPRSCEHCPGAHHEITAAEVPTVPHPQPFEVTTATTKSWALDDGEPEVADNIQCASCNDPMSPSFQREYNGWDHDFGMAGVPIVGGNGYAIAGYTHLSLNGDLDCDAALTRLDPDGNVIWFRELFTGANALNLEDLNDPLNRLEHAYAVGQTNDNGDVGFIVAGDVDYKNSTQDQNMLLMKVDKDGNSQWARTFGQRNTGENDVAKSVQQTFDGGYIVAGYSNSNFTTTAQWGATPAGYNVYVVKTDANGNIGGPNTWAYVYGGDRDDYAYHVEATDDNNDGIINDDDQNNDNIPDDGYIVVGYSNSFSQVVNGALDDDIYVIKLRSNGTVEWDAVYETGSGSNGFGPLYEDHAFWVTEVDDNDVDLTRNNGYAIAGFTNYNGAGSVYILHIDDSGNPIWDRALSRTNPNETPTAYSVTQGTDLGLILAGWTPTNDRKDQSFMIKADICGTHEWTKMYPEVPVGSGGTIQDDHAVSAFQVNNGGYVGFGSTCSFASYGKADLHIARTACNGDLCNSTDESWNIVTPGCHTVPHTTEQNVGDIEIDETHGTYDLYSDADICFSDGPGVIVPMESLRPTNTSDAPDLSAAPGDAESAVRVVPMPVRRGEHFSLQLLVPVGSSTQVVVTDLLGHVVRQSVISGDDRLSAPISTVGWAPGTYIVRVMFGDTVVGVAKVVVVE